jgi:hypothetical protein
LTGIVDRTPWLTRRRLLTGVAIGGVALPLGLAAPLRSAAAADRVSLPDVRARGATDDRAALAAALKTGRIVHLPAGRGTGPGGAYLLSAGPDAPNLPAGARLVGDGIGRTIVHRLYGGGAAGVGEPFVFFCDSGSPDPSRNLAGISIADMTLVDDVVRNGFAEHEHLINVNGVTSLRIERVGFQGFRGDGLYLGSSTFVDGERHNVDVVVRDCEFDGINTNNRNGISIIDGDRVTIDRCRFRRCSRHGGGGLTPPDPFNPRTGLGMPGGIDIEPNGYPFTIVRDIAISNCQFDTIGGAAVALLLRPNDSVRVPLRGIRVTGCVVRNTATGIAFGGYGARNALRGLPYDVEISDNSFTQADSPFIIDGAVGLTLRRNRFTDCAKAAELGYTNYNHDVQLIDNEFTRVGYSRDGVNGMLIRYADQVTLEGNSFVDCGRADGSAGRAINFERGDITRFRLINNRFESPGKRTAMAVDALGGKIDPRSFTSSGNIYGMPTNERLR